MLVERIQNYTITVVLLRRQGLFLFAYHELLILLGSGVSEFGRALRGHFHNAGPCA